MRRLPRRLAVRLLHRGVCVDLWTLLFAVGNYVACDGWKQVSAVVRD